MSLPIIVRPEADADIQGIYDSLEMAIAGLGDRFIAKLREKFEFIERMPEMYGIVWKDVRAVRIKRFRYVLYYIAFEDRVEVIGILHGSRDAPAWQARAAT